MPLEMLVVLVAEYAEPEGSREQQCGEGEVPQQPHHKGSRRQWALTAVFVQGHVPAPHSTALSAWLSSSASCCPSPSAMRVWSRWTSAFSRPDNPAPLPRLMTMTFFALSAFRIGMP